MKKALFGVAVAMLLAGAGIVAGNDGPKFEARLTGAQEVPPVNTETVGKVEIRFNADETKADFELDVRKGVRVTQAHIHCAAKGVNGPVVVLAGFHNRGWDVDGSWVEHATVTDANVMPPASPACPHVIATLRDLVLIDGGRGQLSAAYEALEQVGLGNLVAIGIAKKEEVLFTRDRPEPIVLPENDAGLLLLQRIRDEAHRFAVTFHRQARSMRDLRSALDEVPGIGPRRRRALLTRFGSLAGVRRATREELEAVVGARAAGAIIDFFAQSG